MYRSVAKAHSISPRLRGSLSSGVKQIETILSQRIPPQISGLQLPLHAVFVGTYWKCKREDFLNQFRWKSSPKDPFNSVFLFLHICLFVKLQWKTKTEIVNLPLEVMHMLVWASPPNESCWLRLQGTKLTNDDTFQDVQALHLSHAIMVSH